MLACVPTERDHSRTSRCRIPPVEVREIASRFSVSCCDQGSYQVSSHRLRASAAGRFGENMEKLGRAFTDRVAVYIARSTEYRRQVAGVLAETRSDLRYPIPTRCCRWRVEAADARHASSIRLRFQIAPFSQLRERRLDVLDSSAGPAHSPSSRTSSGRRCRRNCRLAPAKVSIPACQLRITVPSASRRATCSVGTPRCLSPHGFCTTLTRCPHLHSNPFKGLQSSTREGRP